MSKFFVEAFHGSATNLMNLRIHCDLAGAVNANRYYLMNIISKVNLLILLLKKMSKQCVNRHFQTNLWHN